MMSLFPIAILLELLEAPERSRLCEVEHRRAERTTFRDEDLAPAAEIHPPS